MNKKGITRERESSGKLTQLVRLESFGIWIEAVEGRLVDERVLPLGAATSIEDGVLGGADNGLDFVRVDDSGYVGVGNFGRRKAVNKGMIKIQGFAKAQYCVQVVVLADGSLIKGTINLVEQLEGALSPDDKATKVTTGSELKEVQAVHIGDLNTRQVAECLGDALVLAVHDKRTTTLAVATVPHLALTSTKLPRIRDLDNISVCTESLKQRNGFLSLGDLLGISRNDERDLLDLFNAVSAREDEGGKSRCGEGRNNSVASLVLVHLDVPLAPGFGRSEHTPTTAHITERSLSA